MKTKKAIEFAAHMEGATNEIQKVKKSKVADTISNTLALVGVIALKAAVISEGFIDLGVDAWIFLAIAIIPAWYISDLIVTQMVSSELEGDKGAIWISIVSFVISTASLSDSMFDGATSIWQILTWGNLMNFLIIIAISAAPIVIIHYSVKAWKRKLTVEIDGELVYLPDHINSELMSEAADQFVIEQKKSMTSTSTKILAKNAKSLFKNQTKLTVLNNTKKAS